MHSATVSCVCSTRGSPRAMNSHLLFFPLLLLRAPSARPLFSLALWASTSEAPGS